MNLLRWLFGCTHANTSRVFTLRNYRGKKESYIVCFDCSKPILYDWEHLGEYEPDYRDLEGYTDAPAELEIGRYQK